ncbi:hypothetical protein [Halorhodospira sp. 9622]|uniref:hypothetical protein n=1 Tax=Halorhodospira sp. 9622 TaxID=2899136 RepID=UPI001EE8FF2D|nr:hypothetical protein [Halorhodospira sp. 9622]MCG5538959.1 hypothetical protein [Halorhodospira sp. 9622]
MTKTDEQVTKLDRWMIAIGGPVVAALLIWIGHSTQTILSEQAVLQHQMTEVAEQMQAMPSPAEYDHEMEVINSELDHIQEQMHEQAERLDEHERILEAVEE